MAITGNLPNQTASNRTTEGFFNNFYTAPLNTSANINDSVVAYFQDITGSKEIGKNLAAAVIYTALQQNMDPMDIVNHLKVLSTKNQNNAPDFYPGQTNQYAQDTDVYNTGSGTWSTSGKQYAKPGPDTPYSQINEVDEYLTMFLNLNRVGTSLLGLNNSPQTSPYVQRAILA